MVKTFLFQFLIVLLCSCNSGKYATSYKIEKSDVDSIVLIHPFVQIETIDRNGNHQDLTLTQEHKRLIYSTANELLDSKYSITPQDTLAIDMDYVNEIFEKLDESKKLISGIYLSKGDNSTQSIVGSKYALIVFYQGVYNPNFQPDHNVKAGLATNMLIVNPSSKPASTMRVLMINRNTHEVVFYAKKTTREADPRIVSEIEKLTRSILKPIYYK